MARPRKYNSDAEKQAAYRARFVKINRDEWELHVARLEALQAAVERAAAGGDEVALACRAGSPDTILENLAKYFESRA